MDRYYFNLLISFKCYTMLAYYSYVLLFYTMGLIFGFIDIFQAIKKPKTITCISLISLS